MMYMKNQPNFLMCKKMVAAVRIYTRISPFDARASASGSIYLSYSSRNPYTGWNRCTGKFYVGASFQ